MLGMPSISSRAIPMTPRSRSCLLYTSCRLISISGLESIEALKGGGIDLLRDHADDVPAEFVYWINDAYRRGYVDYNADDVVRTEIYDALQTAFQTYDPVSYTHLERGRAHRTP